MLLQPPNLLEKRADKLVLKTKESRLFFAEMVRLKKLIESTILVKSMARSAGGKNYFTSSNAAMWGDKKSGTFTPEGWADLNAKDVCWQLSPCRQF